MKYKSIISLISFLLISMFYVASASAGPTYLNVEMPKECGTWKVSPGAQHCSVRGPASGKAGVDTAFKCWGGGNGKGGVGIDTQHCGRVIFSHHVAGVGQIRHSVRVTTGTAQCTMSRRTHQQKRGKCVDSPQNTLTLEVCRPIVTERDTHCYRSHEIDRRLGGAH
jgi:hypothetical protein